jgi:hypothetical protein
MKMLLFSAGFLLLLSGCGTKKISGDGSGQVIQMKADKGTAKLGKAEMDTQPVKITGATIEDNTLVVSVSYSGGCQDHHFDLVGDEAISKSLPPQRSIRLVHSGERDRCKALILKTLEFDIKDLAYQQESGSEIVLRLEGWDTDLKYVYK